MFPRIDMTIRAVVELGSLWPVTGSGASSPWVSEVKIKASGVNLCPINLKPLVLSNRSALDVLKTLFPTKALA